MKVDRDGNVKDATGQRIGRLWWSEIAGERYYQIHTAESGSEPIRVDGQISWTKKALAVAALCKHLGIAPP